MEGELAREPRCIRQLAFRNTTTSRSGGDPNRSRFTPRSYAAYRFSQSRSDLPKKRARRVVSDGSRLIFARNGSGTVTDEYGYYPGGDQPMSIRLPSGRTGVFITDPQLRGTVKAIADANGQATNMEFKTYSVSPWGEVAADTGTTTRLRLAGQQYDQATRLYFMRARYYDPALGRFLSEDPIGISGGLNLYAYAGNDPVNKADPAGTSEECRLVLYQYTTWSLETGAIVRTWYGLESECHQVPDATPGTSDPGRGPSGGAPSAGSTPTTTAGQAPADTGCRIGRFQLPDLGLTRAMYSMLGNQTFSLGVTLDLFLPEQTGWTGAAGFAVSRDGVRLYHREGTGTGSDVSAGFEGALSPQPSGPAVEGQLQLGDYSFTASGVPTSSGLYLSGFSLGAGTPSLTGASYHVAVTNTTLTGRIIACD